jgi:DNA-damage-inducible protein D
MSQTREKLKRENIRNQRDAIETHEAVGKEVRAAIAKIGGTRPENIPPAEPIKSVEKRIKKARSKLLPTDQGLVQNSSKETQK